MAVVQEKEQLRTQWIDQFARALEFDNWGQAVEAAAKYQEVASSVASKHGLPSMTSMEKETMYRLALCLSAREQVLSRGSHSDTITTEDMKKLTPAFEVLFTGREPERFPVPMQKFQWAQPVSPLAGEIVCSDADDASDLQHVHKVLKNVSGTVVSLRIEKIGLKDAQDYIEPFMTVLIADDKTNLLDKHDTPVAKERRATHLFFNHQLYLNVPLEDMQRQQAALFFEFKHYKPKKKKVSTRCWAFMELSELKQDEEIVLEIYHKPTDLKKKKLGLHSEKPLYLHLYATFVHSS
mmetsp:Transcript_89634/g.254087  ORF Transcript_89634/g.254087 Transcript_89634/m.254087 type:complete len:294 (-) Transcript_89634:103-984(-)